MNEEQQVSYNKKIRAKDHQSYGTFTLVSLLLPFVGIVLGIVYLSKSDPLDKKLGEHAIAFSVLAGVLWSIIWMLLIDSSSNSSIMLFPVSEVQVQKSLDSIYQQVATDAVEEYNIAKRQGDPIQICVQAGFVSAAYLQAKDEANYRRWKDIEKADCARAGLPY